MNPMRAGRLETGSGLAVLVILGAVAGEEKRKYHTMTPKAKSEMIAKSICSRRCSIH
jgi:hypothetical protein